MAEAIYERDQHSISVDAGHKNEALVLDGLAEAFPETGA